MGTISRQGSKVASVMQGQALSKCLICGKPVTNGNIGCTCQRHIGKMGKFYTPALSNPANLQGYIALSKACRIAEQNGFSAYQQVLLTGKDGGTLQPASSQWQVYIYGKRKYLKGTVQSITAYWQARAGLAKAGK